MAFTQQAAASKQARTSGYEGGLSRSLVRTLLIFTFIPLIIMAGAAYLRARTLLREQLVGQMQAQLRDQTGRLDLAVKTKEIRLDRLVRGPSRSAQFDAALHAGPQSTQFSEFRAGLFTDLRSVSAETAHATFSNYMLIGMDGTILMASKPEWQGVSVRDSSLYTSVVDKDHQSFALYDAAPMYPKQLILATISQVRAPSGTALGILVGVTESQELQNILTTLSALNPDSEALYTLPSGALIGTDQYTHQAVAVQLPNTQQAVIQNTVQRVMNNPDGAAETVQFTDDTGVAAFGQVIWLNSVHAGVLYEIHEQTVFGPLNSLIPFTIALFVATLAAMGFVLYLGANRVFRPLTELAEITQAFAEGDFSQRADARSKDEIGLLAQAFNRMAEDLSELYRSLEEKVDERTRQIHTAAEVAQRITSSANLDQLLNRTVQLLVDQFSFYQASIFMLDQRGRYAVLQASYGPAAREMLARGHRLETGSASIIGWVTANRQPRVASDVAEDPFHLKNELLPQTRSEVGIPISIGNLVLGALDVQSTKPAAFTEEDIEVLQIVADQIAFLTEHLDPG